MQFITQKEAYDNFIHENIEEKMSEHLSLKLTMFIYDLNKKILQYSSRNASTIITDFIPEFENKFGKNYPKWLPILASELKQEFMELGYGVDTEHRRDKLSISLKWDKLYHPISKNKFDIENLIKRAMEKYIIAKNN